MRAPSTFSLRACGAAEGAVLVSNEMAAENNVLASLGIFTTNPEGRADDPQNILRGSTASGGEGEVKGS